MNPWNDIPLEIYESHMSLSNVFQLQTLNSLMREQTETFPDAESVAILGVAGGNGLEHCLKRFKLVYGVDVNPAYLKACAQRFGLAMNTRLRLVEMDLLKPESILPKVDLIIADLLIEYIGVDVFCEKAVAARTKYVSCVIQGTSPKQGFVSESPYQAALKGIGKLHRDVAEGELTSELSRHGYILTHSESIDMPNGKRLIRLDYTKKADG